MNKKQYEGRVWRILTNIWTLVTICLFALDFVSGNHFNSSAGATGAIYIAILGIYVSTKEFERWQSRYSASYHGEMYIIIWTIFVIIVSILAPFSEGKLQVPTELVIVYTVVLSVFVVSRRSKALYSRRRSSQLKPLANLKKYVKVRKRKAKRRKK